MKLKSGMGGPTSAKITRKKFCWIEENDTVSNHEKPAAIIHFKTGGLHTWIDWLYLMLLSLCIFIPSVIIGGSLSWAIPLPASEFSKDTIFIGAVFSAYLYFALRVFWLRPCQVQLTPDGFEFGNYQFDFTQLQDVIIKNDTGGDIGQYFSYGTKLHFIVRPYSAQTPHELQISRHYTRGAVLKDVRHTFLELAMRMQQGDANVSNKLAAIAGKRIITH